MNIPQKKTVCESMKEDKVICQMKKKHAAKAKMNDGDLVAKDIFV